MGQNISLVGNWTGVSGIYLEKTGGGMVKFTDTSPTTATDPDVAQGKVYFKADGSQSTGTGGSPTVNLQAKTKTYTPTTSQQTEDVTPDSGYDGLSKVSVTVEAIQTESKSATPSETTQTITPSSGKFLSSVSVGAIASDYVGTGITRRSSSDMTANGATVTAPAGYYSAASSKSVATTEHPAPSVSIDSDGLITATHTQGTGYVTGGTKTATEQLTKRTSADLTASGATVTAPAGYYPAAASKSVASGSARTPATTITANPTITIDGATGEITASVSASKNITPTVSAGYVSAGTAGTVTASGSATEQLTVLTDEDVYGTVTDTASTRTNEVVIPAGLVPTGGIRPEIFAEAYFDDTDASFSIGSTGSITANFNPRFAGMAYTHGNYSITKAGAVSVQAGGRITPTESQQTAIPGSTYALEPILVDGIPTTYVGSGVTRRTSSSLTESGGTVTAPAGYYAADATFQFQEQDHPRPAVSIDSDGLITATHTQAEGWTRGGTTSKTLQVDTDAGGTYTPNRTTQHVVQEGHYMTGDVYVGPIPSEYIIPSGTTTITENGEYDVLDFDTAIVNVAAAAGGLEYETGIWTPDESTARPTISFANQHSEPPIAILMADGTGTPHSATQSNYLFVWFDAQRFAGHGFPYSSSGYRYEVAYYSYRANSTSSISNAGTLCSQQTTSDSASGVNYPKYWATASEFHPYSGSTGRTWKSGRSYHWIAIWKP